MIELEIYRTFGICSSYFNKVFPTFPPWKDRRLQNFCVNSTKKVNFWPLKTFKNASGPELQSLRKINN